MLFANHEGHLKRVFRTKMRNVEFKARSFWFENEIVDVVSYRFQRRNENFEQKGPFLYFLMIKNLTVLFKIKIFTSQR